MLFCHVLRGFPSSLQSQSRCQAIRRICGCTALAACLAFCGAPTAPAAVWDDGGATDDWSDFSNWSDDADPAGKDVDFNATGTLASGVTSVVDTSLSIDSLLAMWNAASSQHTLQINPSQTLTITGSRPLSGLGFTPAASGNAAFFVGQEGGGNDLNFNFTGAAGSLVVNSPTNDFIVSNIETTNYARVDMSGLEDFEANVTNFRVGYAYTGDGGTNNLTRGELTLAQNNEIVATNFEIGIRNADSTPTGVVHLGESNTLYANTFRIGRVKGNGTLDMQTGLTNPNVTIRAKDGSSAAAMLVGFFDVSSSAAPSIGTVNFNGAQLDALFSTLTIGSVTGGTPGAGTNGAFSFDQGTVTATTILMGQALGGGSNTANLTVGGTGTLNATTVTLGRRGASTGLGHGTLTIEGSGLAEIANLRLGDQTTNTGSAAEGFVTLNDSGVLRAGSISRGPGVGTGLATRRINFNSGTIRNLTGTDLTITSDIEIRLDTAGTHALAADAGRTISYTGVVTELAPGASGLTFNGAGTVLLNGASTFTGDSTLVSGTLTGNGSLAGDLNMAGGTLAPGTSVGAFTIGGGEFSGGKLAIELGGVTPLTEHDQLLATGHLELGGTLEITMLNGFVPSSIDQFIVVDAGTISGMFDQVLITNLPGGFDVIYNAGLGQVILSNYQIPEPNTAMLLSMGLLALRRKMRRSKGE